MNCYNDKIQYSSVSSYNKYQQDALFTFKFISIINLDIDLFHLPTLMHNYFIHQQYVCYITILDMFRALTCPSSGGQIVFSQHLVLSLSVQYSTVCRMRTDCRAEIYRNSSIQNFTAYRRNLNGSRQINH